MSEHESTKDKLDRVNKAFSVAALLKWHKAASDRGEFKEEESNPFVSALTQVLHKLLIVIGKNCEPETTSDSDTVESTLTNNSEDLLKSTCSEADLLSLLPTLEEAKSPLNLSSSSIGGEVFTSSPRPSSPEIPPWSPTSSADGLDCPLTPGPEEDQEETADERLKRITVHIGSFVQDLEADIMAEAAKKKLRRLQACIESKLTYFTVEDIHEGSVHTFDDDCKELKNLQDSLFMEVAEASDVLDEDELGRFQTSQAELQRRVVTRIRAVSAKAIEVKNQIATQVQEARMGSRRGSIESLDSLTSTESRARRKDVAKVNSKLNELNEDAEKLLKEVNEENWEEADDIEIRHAMKNIDRWRNGLDKLLKLGREVDILSVDSPLPVDVTDDYKELLHNAKLEVEGKIRLVRAQDKERMIFTDFPGKAEVVKLPIFHGNGSEDFVKFEEKLRDAFKRNRIVKNDQLTKLRQDCLRDLAKKLVPESTNDIEDALNILRHSFGDPSTVMMSRKESLLKLGNYPSDSGRSGGSSKQVEWLCSLEVIVKEIMEIGDRSEDMGMEAFNQTTIFTIINLFTGIKKTQVLKVLGLTGKARLNAIVTKIDTFREESLAHQLVESVDLRRRGSLPSTDDKGDKQAKGKFGAVSKYVPPSKIVQFTTPKRMDDCRICKFLDENGDTVNLYDSHFNTFPTGCPRYIQMSVEKRLEVAKKTRICLRCHSPKYLWKGKDFDHSKDCSLLTKGKAGARFMCRNATCQFHLWICVQHKDENEIAAQSFNEEMRKKGLQFGFHVNLMVNTASRQINEEENEDDADYDDEGIENYMPIDFIGSCHSNNSKCREERFKKVATELEKRANAEVHPVPEGEPLFLFSSYPGNTRDLNFFWDGGCSHVVFEEGVPGKELDGMITLEGPFNIGGIGDNSVKANNEWLCTIKTTDNKKQFLHGLTMDKLCGEMPQFSLKNAVQDIKKRTNNTWIKNAKLPERVGGHVDVLIGIKYNRIFPWPKHTLESGLTIYELRTEGVKGCNAVIGGPHESFNYMLRGAGNTASLLAHFTQSLAKFRSMGPPNLTRREIDFDYETFAKQMNQAEMEKELEAGSLGEIAILEDECTIGNEHDGLGCPLTPGPEDVQLASRQSEISGDGPQECLECGNVFNVNIDPEDKINRLKRLQPAIDGGLNIEYRCSRCRNCASCKKAVDTERISLREEAEVAVIEDSVQLDSKNKQITATLPLRGKEEDFLASNRSKAVKVLDSQCRKYSTDEETKEQIIKSLKKLLANGHVKLLDDIPEEIKNLMLAKPVQNYIEWRVVFKSSISTPCRLVFDASSKTPTSEDGKTGGRCLNDLLMKGRVVTLDLVKMMLRFELLPFALLGDLMQFYCSVKLKPENWNLQRMIFRPDLNPNAELIEAVITTLIFGVKSSSAQTEAAILKLADLVEKGNPDLSDMLKNGRFVDDIADSQLTSEGRQNLMKAADGLFKSFGLEIKGWAVSGEKPSENISADGQTLMVGGLKYKPELDCLEIPIPPLHFGSKARGRLRVGTEVFDGEFADLESFVPKNLTRKQVFSKFMSVFDIYGKLTPAMSTLRNDVRMVVKDTETWDSPVNPNLRSKWIDNFWRLEKLKGMYFSRPVMPKNAVNTKLRLISCVDFAQLIITGVWGGFELPDGTYSCQLLIGRGLLGKEDSTIPKGELEALCAGSNLLWIVRKALERYVDSNILVGDSTIAICWASNDRKRLSLFHRNRVIQIRRGTLIEEIFHCESANNPSDVGTRPDTFKEDDVGPLSVWENGKPWMKQTLDSLVESGTLVPATTLKISEEKEKQYEEGFVYEKVPEILTPGHVAQVAQPEDIPEKQRTSKILKRAKVSNYLLSPTKFKFDKVVRIHGYVSKFLRIYLAKSKLYNEKVCRKAKETEFSIFHISSTELSEEIDQNKDVLLGNVEEVELKSYFNANAANVYIETTKMEIVLSTEDINEALYGLFIKATTEVKEFNSKVFLKKISVEKNGILYHKGRILDGQRFILAGGFEELNILNEKSINVLTPLVDRFSPLGYSLSLYVHEVIAKHAGAESSHRSSLNFAYVMGGGAVYREIVEDCVKCAMLRKRFIEVAMGPVSDSQLTIAPPFWVTMGDIFGPIVTYVPGFERSTRNRPARQAKCYLIVFGCPTTKLVNIQTLEGKDTDSVISGLIRLSCEVGAPKHFLIDQDSAIMKALQESEVPIKDVQRDLRAKVKIEFSTCPVSGHNFHGFIERKIRTIQNGLNLAGIDKLRLVSQGLQTLAKLVENDVNNIPLGYAYGRNADNSPLLRMLTPNMMRMGRNNVRALDGPIVLPTGPIEMMKKVEQGYAMWFRVFNDVLVPLLVHQPKWFKSSRDLKMGDLVFFKKQDSALSSKWSVGVIEYVEKSKDGLIRRAQVRYYNGTEDKIRFTDRAVRSLVKLFSVDDNVLQKDLYEVELMLKEAGIDIRQRGDAADIDASKPTNDGLGGPLTPGPKEDQSAAAAFQGDMSVGDEDAMQNEKEVDLETDSGNEGPDFCSKCCCVSHCQLKGLTAHACRWVKSSLTSQFSVETVNIHEDIVMNSSIVDVFDAEEEIEKSSELHGGFNDLLLRTDVDFDQ